MEQAKRKRAHLERILLVCGDQNAGKSRLLRNMFGDDRLGGVVATGPRITPRRLSRERELAARFSSPHEKNMTEAEFHNDLDGICKAAWTSGWRVNIAQAIQPNAANQMPDIVATCAGLKREFLPERIRVVVLAPDRSSLFTSQLTTSQVDGLRRLDVEVCTIDARAGTQPVEPGNVRILADFFDFS